MENLILQCKPPPLLPIPSSKQNINVPQFHNVTETHLHNLSKNGNLEEAVKAIDKLAQSGSKVSSLTFSNLLQSCIDYNSIEFGRKLHRRIGLVDEIDVFLETKLVGMYAKCGSLEDAWKLFEGMRERNLYTWSAMIGACCREQRWKEAVQLFGAMVHVGVLPDEFLWPKVLQAVGNCRNFEVGRVIHSIVVKVGMAMQGRVGNSILSVYVKCGRMELSKKCFEQMTRRDLVAWNAMISGYCRGGDMDEGMRWFNLMIKERIEPGVVTWNILISSYSQSGNCDLAVELMEKMENAGVTRDVFTWTSVISGFAQNNRNHEALELFREMLLSGVEPSGVTITSVISACASLKDLDDGKQLHLLAVKMGLARDTLVGNALVDMYFKCNQLDSALKVFNMILRKDVFSWNSMIAGYCQAGYCSEAHDLFMKIQKSDVQLNALTWNIMIFGYMQNGDVTKAMDLFLKMENCGIKRDTASWNALITGLLQNGQKAKALENFRLMQWSGVAPNSFTLLSVLRAFANLLSFNKVREVHGCALRICLDSELSVQNALIDTYVKSGNIRYSRNIFDRMLPKDIISWNSMIAGYVLHGCADSALELYSQMKNAGVRPNRGTFLSLILAFSLAQMIDEGKNVFTSMNEDYQISPGLEHYAAVVNLLGRSGQLKEAVKFIECMPLKPESSIWDALLTAGRVHRDIGLVLHAGEQLLELEPGNNLTRHLVMQALALTGRSDDTSKVRNPKRWDHTKVHSGLSCIEVRNVVLTFGSGDRPRPYSDLLYSWVQKIRQEVKALDCHDELGIEEEECEEICGVHSEKLALGFAFLGSESAPKIIRITKNIRICGDCHRTAKFISLAYDCEVYLNDSKGFHHFKNGQCSCKDYW